MSDTPRTDAVEPNYQGRTRLIDDYIELARQLERELAEARKDAERYRWLRNDAGDLGVLAGEVLDWSEEYSEQAVLVPLDGAELDAAIDAAIANTSSPPAQD